MNGNEALLDIEMTQREKSKDSHWSDTGIKIFKNCYEIKKTYGGFKAPENEEISGKIDEKRFEEIRAYLQENGFHGSINEKKKSEGTGLKGSLRIQGTFPEKVDIRIEGMLRIWGSDDFVKREWGSEYVESRTNLKNREWFSRVDGLVYFLSGKGM